MLFYNLTLIGFQNDSIVSQKWLAFLLGHAPCIYFIYFTRCL